MRPSLLILPCLQTIGSGVSLPPTREDFRTETLTLPDLLNLGPLGRPGIVSVKGLALPAVPSIAMGS